MNSKNQDLGSLKDISGAAFMGTLETIAYCSPNGSRVVFCRPGAGNEGYSLSEFTTISQETLRIVNESQLDEKKLDKLNSWLAFPGEVIARCKDLTVEKAVQDSKSEVTLLIGPHIALKPSGEYVAQCCGYVVLREHRLELCSPLWIDAKMQNVYWLLLSPRWGKGKVEMLDFWFRELELSVQVDTDAVVKKMETFSAQVQSAAMLRIARGKLPESGTDGWGELLVNLEKQFGGEQEDGSVDYYDANLIPTVTKDQVLAKYYPARPGEAGYDVYGKSIPAVDGKDKEIVCGKNVRQGKEGGLLYYYATRGGTISFEHNTLSVHDLLVLEKGVNFETGNIDFLGKVQISGPILPGFTVKAEGDIVISGMIENDTTIISGGNIDVGHGIAGRKTLVQAGGSITAQFVHEAKLVAGSDITLGNYSFHAVLRSGNSIVVKKGIGERAGCIVGGKTWAKKEIEASVAGAPTWPATELLIGLTVEQAEALDKLQQDIESHSIHIKKILEHFGLPRIDLEQIKKIINKADGATRKGLAFRAKHLAKLAESYKKLLEQRKEFMNSISELPKGACVRIKEMIYPGVLVFLGSKEQKITEELPGINIP